MVQVLSDRFFHKNLAILWAVASAICHASCVVLQAQQLPFHNYTAREGLPSNSCFFFFQDRDGFLWTSTESGLSRFDGRHFTNYEKTGAGKIIGLTISLAQTSDGHIWAGGNGNGLFEFDGKDFRHYNVGDQSRSNYVTALLETAPNVLLVGTEAGLFELRRGHFRPIVQDAQMMRTYKFSAAGSLFKDAKGQIWVLFDGKLRRLDPSNGSFLENLPYPSPDDAFDWATLLSDGRFVVGCAKTKRVYVFKGHQPQYTLSFEDRSIRYAVEDSEGFLWVHTNKGVLKTPLADPTLQNGQWLSTENGLPSNVISTIFLDQERNLWFGSYGKGIYKLEAAGTYRFSYPFAAGLGCADAQGRLWFSTPDGLRVIGRGAAGSWAEQRLAPFPDKYFKSMGTVMVLPDNQLWLGGDDGTLVNYRIEASPKGILRLRYRREIGPKTGFASAKPIWMFFDRKGRLWYSDMDAPNLRVVDISQEKPRLIKTLPFDPGVRLSNGRELMEDDHGNFWFAYETNNVLLFDAQLNLVKTLKNIPGDPEVDVNCLHRDRDGAIWYGTHTKGLIRQMPDGRIVHISKAEGLLSDRITRIVEGPDRTLWIATWHGLAMVQYHGDSLRIYGDKEVTQSPIWSLGVFPDGTGWVATNFEVVFHKSRAFQRPKPPTVALRRVLVNGIERPFEDGLELPIHENDLVLEFGTVSLQSRYTIHFQHRLEVNGKGHWSQPSELESVNFAGLKPGDYRFWVKAVTSEGLESAPTQLSFRILPPFWQRWWFILGNLLFVGALVWLFIRQRVLRLLEIERLRARIAADLHDDIGSGLTRIALASELLLRQKAEPTQRGISHRIGEAARELVESMSDIVWAIDPQNDSLAKAANRIRLFAHDLCEAKDIECTIEFNQESLAALKPGADIASSLILISKEALNNAVRHAQCSHITITISIAPKELCLLVQDDGSGFEEQQLARVNGLNNMRRRAEKAGGRLEITSKIGVGTVVEVWWSLG